MLEAYYDCSCNSHELFDDLAIANDPDYEKHLNQYNVLYLDITGFMADTTIEGLPAYISKEIVEDAADEYPDIARDSSVKKALSRIVEKTGRKFVAIIDPSPAMIIELKARGTPEEAIAQMRQRNYAASVECPRSRLLVAITYDKDDKTKPHHCRMEGALKSR